MEQDVGIIRSNSLHTSFFSFSPPAEGTGTSLPLKMSMKTGTRMKKVRSSLFVMVAHSNLSAGLVV